MNKSELIDAMAAAAGITKAAAKLALECRDVNTSDLELLTPSYCRRCLL